MIKLLCENDIKYVKCDKSDFTDMYLSEFIDNKLDEVICAVKNKRVISCLLVSKFCGDACIQLHSLSDNDEIDMRFLLVSIYDLVKCGSKRIYYYSDSYLSTKIDIIESEQPFFQIKEIDSSKKVLIRNT